MFFTFTWFELSRRPQVFENRLKISFTRGYLNKSKKYFNKMPDIKEMLDWRVISWQVLVEFTVKMRSFCKLCILKQNKKTLALSSLSGSCLWSNCQLQDGDQKPGSSRLFLHRRAPSRNSILPSNKTIVIGKVWGLLRGQLVINWGWTKCSDWLLPKEMFY